MRTRDDHDDRGDGSIRPARRRHRPGRGDRGVQLLGTGDRRSAPVGRAGPADPHRPSRARRAGQPGGDQGARLRRPHRTGRVIARCHHSLQHLLGPLPLRPSGLRAGRGQLTNLVPGRPPSGRPPHRPHQHHPSLGRVALWVLPGQGAGRAGAGRGRGSVRHRPARHPVRARRGAPQQHRLAAPPAAGLRRRRPRSVPRPAHSRRRPGPAVRGPRPHGGRQGGRCGRAGATGLHRSGPRDPRRGRQPGPDRPGPRSRDLAALTGPGPRPP